MSADDLPIPELARGQRPVSGSDSKEHSVPAVTGTPSRSVTMERVDSSVPSETRQDLSEAGHAVQRAIEHVLRNGVEGSSQTLDSEVLTEVLKDPAVSRLLITGETAAGDTGKLESVLREHSTVDVKQVSEALEKIRSVLIQKQAQLTTLSSLAELFQGENTQAHYSENTLRVELEQLLVRMNEGSSITPQVLSESAERILRAGIDVANAVPVSVQPEVQALSVQLRTLSTQEPFNPEAELPALTKKIQTLLDSLSNPTNDKRTLFIKQLEESLPYTRNAKDLETIQQQVRQFMQKVHQASSLELAKSAAARILENAQAGSTSTGGLTVEVHRIQKVLQTIETSARVPAAALEQLTVSVEVLERLRTTGTIEKQVTLRSALTELIAQSKNILLEANTTQALEATLSRVLSTATNNSTVEAAVDSIRKVLADIPSGNKPDIESGIEDLRNFMLAHQTSSTTSNADLISTIERMRDSDSLTQIYETLHALKESVATRHTRAEVLTYQFAESALARFTIDEKAGIKPVQSTAFTLLQTIKTDLDSLRATLLPDQVQHTPESSEALEQIFSQRQRTLLLTLEKLLENGLQELAFGTPEGAAEVVNRIQNELLALVETLKNTAGQSNVDLPERLQQTVVRLTEELQKGVSLDRIRAVLQEVLSEVQQTLQAGDSRAVLASLRALEAQLSAVAKVEGRVETAVRDQPRGLEAVIRNIVEEIRAKDLVVDKPVQQFLERAVATAGSSVEQFLLTAPKTATSNTLHRHILDQLSALPINPENLKALQDAFAPPVPQFETGRSSQEIFDPLQALETLLQTQQLHSQNSPQVAAEFQNVLTLINHIKTHGASEESPFERSLAAVVQQMSGAFEQALRGDTQQKHEVLVQFSDLVRREVLKQLPAGRDSSTREKSIKALRELEALVKGQEALLTMAPIIDAAGDPIFVLFPLLLEGFLAKVELTYYGKKDSIADEKTKERQKQKNFTQTSITLALPSLGPVAVHFSYTSEEVLCELQFEQQTIADFIAVRIPKLEAAFARAGYKEFSCAVSVGPVESQAPEWSKRFMRPGVIA